MADLRDVAKQLGLRIYGSGLMRCPSPEHNDEKPSCCVGPQSFACQSCGAKGDTIALVRLVTGKTFVQAREFLGESGPILPPVAPTEPIIEPATLDALLTVSRLIGRIPITLDFRRYWEGRGLSAEVAHSLGFRCASGLNSRVVPKIEPWFGLQRDGSQGFWWPIARRSRGCLVPQRVPGVNHAILWRFRLYTPLIFVDKDTQKPRKVKSVAMSGPLIREAWGISGPAGTEAHIVEGEPDWVAYRMRFGEGRIIQRSGGTSWRPWSHRMMGGASTWVVSIHQNLGSDEFLRIVSDDAIKHGATVVDRRVPESMDWADRVRTEGDR